jgi:hypothetical protein
MSEVKEKQCDKCHSWRTLNLFCEQCNTCVDCLPVPRLRTRQWKQEQAQLRTIGQKRCTRCLSVQSLVEFHANKALKDGLCAHCKTCQRVVSNSERVRNRSALRYQAKRDITAKSKLQQRLACAECGKVTVFLALGHFDAASKARRRNGSKIKSLYSLPDDKLRVELQKGRWLCHYCERKETHLQRQADAKQLQGTSKWNAVAVAERRAVVQTEMARRGSCAECNRLVGTEFFYFDFDHRPGEHKVDTVSNLVNKRRPVQIIKAEMAKCDLVDRECHVRRTRVRFVENRVKAIVRRKLEVAVLGYSLE